MPYYEYECPDGHLTEHLVLPKAGQIAHEAKPAVIDCGTCGRTAAHVEIPSRLGVKFEMFFGSEYGFAGPASRDAWHKNPHVTEWVGKGT